MNSLPVGFLFISMMVLAAMCCGSADGQAVEITAEPAHHLVFENEYVRVFDVKVAPGSATLLHQHRHDYVFLTLGETHVSNEVQGKEAVELKLKDGDVRFVSGNFAHVARNLASTPFHNIAIELMQDEKLRGETSRWKDDSGGKTFAGGSRKTLFVKGGVRVSENDIDAGATIAKHHHDGPHLLVALDEFELKTEVDGQPTAITHFKPGDIRWVPGNTTHTVTNTSKQVARLVAVEF